MCQSNKLDLSDKTTSQDFYNQRYINGYMDDFWSVEHKQRIYEIIKGLQLPESGKALDFGCGDGTFTEIIRQALPCGWKVYGVDISSVAIEKAKKNYPHCNFYLVGAEELAGRKFHYLFSHHVLEHVYDLTSVIQEMENHLQPTCTMFHVLPCGNEGSLEYQICSWRRNGIDPNLGNRFFFEEPGHIRRLNTGQMVNLFSSKRFSLIKEYYINHYYGSIDWITQSGPKFVWRLTDASFANDKTSKRNLERLRFKLLPLSVIRYLTSGVEIRVRERKKTLRNYIFLIFTIGPYVFTKPLSSLLEFVLKRKAFQEWQRRKTEPNGSGMYLVFAR